MNIAQLLGILRGRRREAIYLFLLVLVLAIAAYFFVKPQYTAKTAVVLNLKSNEALAGIALPGGLVSSQIATQVDILQSERVLMKAVEEVNLQSKPEWNQNWQRQHLQDKSFKQWAVERLSKKLSVSPSSESTVLTVNFTSDDAQFAADLANAVVTAYVATSLEMRLDPARQYSQYFDERATALRTALEHAQAKLLSYQRSSGLIVTNEKVNLEVDRLKELSSRLTGLEAAASESSTRSGQASRSPERMQEVLSDKLVASLTEEISRQEAKLGEISERLGDNNPNVIESRSRIRALTQRREAAVSRILGSIKGSADMNQAQLKDLERDLKAQQALVMDLESRRLEASLLEREIEGAQRAYDAVMAKASQASLQSGDMQTGVAVLQVASAPAAQPVIRMARFLAGGTLAGLVLALVFIVVREQYQRRVRTTQDLTVRLGQHLLIEMPRIGASAAPQRSSRFFGMNKKKQTEYRVMMKDGA